MEDQFQLGLSMKKNFKKYLKKINLNMALLQKRLSKDRKSLEKINTRLRFLPFSPTFSMF